MNTRMLKTQATSKTDATTTPRIFGWQEKRKGDGDATEATRTQRQKENEGERGPRTVGGACGGTGGAQQAQAVHEAAQRVGAHLHAAHACRATRQLHRRAQIPARTPRDDARRAESGGGGGLGVLNGRESAVSPPSKRHLKTCMRG